MADSVPILQTIDLSKTFGMVQAAAAINVEVHAGERVGIVGANGSGKTTFLNLITGYYRPDRGRVLFQGLESTGLSPRLMTKLGIARSFQIPQLYTGLTVLENMLLSLAARADRGKDFWMPLYRSELIEEGLDVLGRFGLRSFAPRAAAELPGGARKLLDIALSFAQRPRLLLMDEPTSGVSIDDKFAIMDTLVEVLQQDGTSTVFVEHDMEIVRRYARRILVFDHGALIADGNPASVLARPDVERAVLGRG